jgi:hypothetical protein
MKAINIQLKYKQNKITMKFILFVDFDTLVFLVFFFFYQLFYQFLSINIYLIK